MYAEMSMRAELLKEALKKATRPSQRREPLALAIAMFYAIKWHYDQGEKGATLAMLRAGVKMSVVYVLAILVVGVMAVTVSNTHVWT